MLSLVVVMSSVRHGLTVMPLRRPLDRSPGNDSDKDGAAAWAAGASSRSLITNCVPLKVLLPSPDPPHRHRHLC